ncbi:glycosyltransferase family 2 protein [Candidatus Enterovibrio altilux]|uniref:glycosyltransferase family 2 protein n=1 Tax=Candidatus Enterovibrio altilux TaxID=1927128 RepID=UPI000BBB7F8B|nr:glycosyltransferase family 2 protein [Candidatus Enterovibrio luxaltus]
MENPLIFWFIAISTLLVIYHHLGYPLLLKILVYCFFSTHEGLIPPIRGYRNTKADNILPTIAILMPAYNEAQWIADKIRNLASVDYPNNKLRVIVVCDGCSDDTAQITRQTGKEDACKHLDITVVEYAINEGKVSIINKSMSLVHEDIVAMSDISSLISIDALLIASKHFENLSVGVVNSCYHLLSPTNGEKKYWDYQNTLQHREAKMGATLGAHGALYLIRRRLFAPLAADTINDDFVLPMSIMVQGYRVNSDDTINAIELEPTNANQDFNRRIRIGAGNYQQLIRLTALLNPKYGGVAFTFASGKALRVVMPFFMLIALGGWMWLAQYHILFAIGTAVQLFIYAVVAAITMLNVAPKNTLIVTLCYLVSGHAANMIGTLKYIVSPKSWR